MHSYIGIASIKKGHPTLVRGMPVKENPADRRSLLLTEEACAAAAKLNPARGDQLQTVP